MYFHFIFCLVRANVPSRITCLFFIFLAKVDAETDSERQTPMHYAAKYNSLATMKLLIKFDGSIIQRDAQNRTVLFLAAEQGQGFLSIPKKARSSNTLCTPYDRIHFNLNSLTLPTTGGGGGGGHNVPPLSDFLSVYFNRWSYEADFLWLFLKFYTGNEGGKKIFIGQKIWPHRLVCRWPPTDSGLFGNLESKKNKKLGKLAY